MFIRLNRTNFDSTPYLAAESATEALLDFGAIEDSIKLYPSIINEKPGVVASAYIPSSNPTAYQARYPNLLSSGVTPRVQILERCVPCWSRPPDMQLYSGYVPMPNSTEYQARFPISDNSFGIVGSGNETRMKSLLRSINVTVPSQKKKSPTCQPIDFDYKIFSGEGQFCTDGLLELKGKVLGIETSHMSVNLIKRGLYCSEMKLGVFGGCKYCFRFDKKGYCVYTNGTVHFMDKKDSWNEKILCIEPSKAA